MSRFSKGDKVRTNSKYAQQCPQSLARLKVAYLVGQVIHSPVDDPDIVSVRFITHKTPIRLHVDFLEPWQARKVG